MIRLFRRIRKQLVQENKKSRPESHVRKYILYATGEIILVMVGILLALQVNNWNENRKNNISEQKYLKILKEEFEYNQSHLTTVMALNARNISNGLQLLQLTGPDEPLISEKKFDSILVNTIGYEIEMRPRNEVLDEVISSGKLSLFKNSELKTALSSWAGAVKRVRFQEAELSKYRFQLLDLVMELINLRQAIYNATGGIFEITASKFNNANTKILQMQEFESLLTSFVGASNFASQRFTEIEIKIDEMLHLIELEIKY